MTWIKLQLSPYSDQDIPSQVVLCVDEDGDYMVGRLEGTHDGNSDDHYFICNDGRSCLNNITHYSIITRPDK